MIMKMEMNYVAPEVEMVEVEVEVGFAGSLENGGGSQGGWDPDAPTIEG